MAGFDPQKAVRYLKSSRLGSFAALAIGYPGDPESLPQALKDREVAPEHASPSLNL